MRVYVGDARGVPNRLEIAIVCCKSCGYLPHAVRVMQAILEAD